MEIDMNLMEVKWKNNKTTVLTKLESNFENQNLFLFVSLGSYGQSVYLS